jgi:hypothetical protein
MNDPSTGSPAIARMREEEREGPGEVFTVTTDILAVDGPTAVVRAEVIYGDPPRARDPLRKAAITPAGNSSDCRADTGQPDLVLPRKCPRDQ